MNAENDLIGAHPRIDCDMIPGWVALDQRLFAVVNTIVATDARGMRGLKAKAQVLRMGFIVDSFEWTAELAASLAANVLQAQLGEVA